MDVYCQATVFKYEVCKFEVFLGKYTCGNISVKPMNSKLPIIWHVGELCVSYMKMLVV